MNPLHQVLAVGGAAAAVISIGWIAYGIASPRSNLWGPVISCASVQCETAALTFDDGPSADVTPRILDILADLQVRATFFVIGQNVRRWPDVLRRIDADGHLIGNHTYDHAHYGLFGGPKYLREQIDHTDDVIAQIIGKKPALFRPPMGVTTATIQRSARRSKHKVVTWTLRAMDGVQGDTDQILCRLLAPAKGGEIMVLHDGIDPHIRKTMDLRRNATVNAIRPLVLGLRAKAIEPVRLDELLNVDGYIA